MTEEKPSSGIMEESFSSEFHSGESIIEGSPRQNGGDRRSTNVDQKGSLTHGVLQVFGRLIPSFVFRVKAIYILWLPRERWVPPKDHIWLRWATVADEEQLADLVHRTVNVQSRLNWGGRGVIREKDGQIIGCL